MHQTSFEEISILRKEGNPTMPMHQWDYLRIFRSWVRNLASNLPESDMPFSKQWPLIFGKVFV
jgi:hypothetical protein